ncbi:MAG: ankyrin repeat domain-containing protein [Trueperaceae bacterium]
MRILVTFLTVLVLLAAGVFGLRYFKILDIPAVATQFLNRNEEQAATKQIASLFEVVKSGDVTALETTIAEGADINAQDQYGQTPLMYAASSSSNTDVLNALFKAGANLNAQTSSGWTALMYAARDSQSLDTLLWLMNAAADPSLKNSEGQSAADLARSNPKMTTAIYERLNELANGPFDPNWPSGYTVPVEGATISSRPAHWPGAPRAYRNGTHEGFDFYGGAVAVAVEYGTPIRAVASGVVVRSDLNYVEMTLDEYNGVIEVSKRSLNTPPEMLDKLRGRQVWVEHAGGYVSRYAHLASIPSTLTIGSRIKQGDIVGETGNSGTLEAANNTQDDPHPHVEIWKGEDYLGHTLERQQIYDLAKQVFGEKAMPSSVEQ